MIPPLFIWTHLHCTGCRTRSLAHVAFLHRIHEELDSDVQYYRAQSSQRWPKLTRIRGDQFSVRREKQANSLPMQPCF